MFSSRYNKSQLHRERRGSVSSKLTAYSEDRDRLVVKSNELIQKSRFSLTVQQQRIILYLISKIEYGDEDFKEYEFNIKDFCRVCGLYDESGKYYPELKRQVKAIRDKSMWIEISEGEEVLLSWLDGAHISRNSGKIKVRLNKDMKPYLLQLRENFTKYEIANVLCMRSKYSIRLYELVKSLHFQELETYVKIFSVDELRKRLDAETYPRFCNFNQRVLKPAVQEINSYTDKEVSYELVKPGKMVEAIAMTVRTKDAADRMKARDMIDKKLGPEQITLWGGKETVGESPSENTT